MSQIATVIASQIGNRALAMMGAKNLLTDERSLQFKIGRNAKGVTHIRIELAADDTYTITFSKVNRRTYDCATLAELSGVYVDNMHDIIEDRTGLALSL